MRKFIVFFFILTLSNVAVAQNWKLNIDEAKALAAKEDKNIILVFSGSDWCAPCIKLDKNIWQSAEFKAEAERNWILVRADFPKKRQNTLSEEQKAYNGDLAEKYNPQGYFPLVVVMDKNGSVLGKTGFKNVSPMEYIALLHSLEK